MFYVELKFGYVQVVIFIRSLFHHSLFTILSVWLVRQRGYPLLISTQNLFVAFMRLPHRSINSIQPLPSIYTTFPSNYDSSQSTDTPGVNSGTCLLKKIEDGIEIVPFERSNILSAPILSPDQNEKEVFVPSCNAIDAHEKPLPNLPRCMWHRMSRQQRILALLVIQFLMLLTIGLSLLAVKDRSPIR